MKSVERLLILFLIVVASGCKSSRYFDNAEVLQLSDDIINNNDADIICLLDESREPLGPISDFSMINDTTFVVVDKRLVSIFNTNGKRKGKTISRGRGKGEILSPSSVCMSPNYIYVWCSTLMKVLALTYEGKFHAEYSGFDRSVKKIAVDDDNHLYLYTSGDLNKAGDAFDDVIRVFDLAQKKITASFGTRADEDEVMFIVANSGGIDFDNGSLIYAHPGNSRFYTMNMQANDELIYQIEDSGFNMQKVEHSEDITADIREWIDFSQKNAVVRGVYCSAGQTYMVAEVGSYDMESRSVGTRKIKVYTLDTQNKSCRAIVYDKFYVGTNFDVRNDSIVFLYAVTEKDTDGRVVQNTYLSALPLN